MRRGPRRGCPAAPRGPRPGPSQWCRPTHTHRVRDTDRQAGRGRQAGRERERERERERDQLVLRNVRLRHREPSCVLVTQNCVQLLTVAQRPAVRPRGGRQQELEKSICHFLPVGIRARSRSTGYRYSPGRRSSRSVCQFRPSGTHSDTATLRGGGGAGLAGLAVAAARGSDTALLERG